MEENKEKKTITLSLSTGVALIVILMLSIVILAGVYFYEIQKIKKENMENTITNTATAENVVPETNTIKEENTTNENTVKEETKKTFITGEYVRYFKNEGRECEERIEFKKDNTFKMTSNAELEGLQIEGVYNISKDSSTITCTPIIDICMPPCLEIEGSEVFRIIDDNTLEVQESKIKYSVEEKLLTIFNVGNRYNQEKESDKISISSDNFKPAEYKKHSNSAVNNSNTIIEFKEDNTFEAISGDLTLKGAYKISEDGTIISCSAISVFNSTAKVPAPNEGSKHKVVAPANGNIDFKIIDNSTIEVLEDKEIKIGEDIEYYKYYKYGEIWKFIKGDTYTSNK